MKAGQDWLRRGHDRTGQVVANSILGLPLDQVDGLLGEDGRLVDLAEKLLMLATMAIISGLVLYYSSHLLYY